MRPTSHVHPVSHRRWARRGRALVCGAGLGLLTGLSGAVVQSPFTATGATPNPGVMPGGGWKWTPNSNFGDPPPSRTWSSGSGAGRVVFSDVVRVAGKAGEVVVTGTQRVTVAEAAGAVARCLLRSVVCAAVAGASYLVYEYYRTRKSPDGDYLEHDPGVDPSLQPMWRCNNPDNVNRPTYGIGPKPACDELARVKSGAFESGLYTYTDSYSVTSCATNQYGTTCQFSRTRSTRFTASGQSAGQPTIITGMWSVDPVSQLACPAVVDFYDPRYSIPGGPTGPDGKCPTGVYGERVTPEQAAQKVVAAPMPVHADGTDPIVEGFKEAMQGGQQAPSTVETTGPATQQGTPVSSTTTGPSGTTTTTTTPTYNYFYEGDTIRYETTTTTTTTNVDGTTTTTVANPKPAEVQDPEDPCTANPGRVGCQELGSAPNDKPKTVGQSLSWSAEVLGLPASCPADRQISTSQGTVVVSYTPTCETAVSLAPWVRAGGALAALFIVLAALRSS